MQATSALRFTLGILSGVSFSPALRSEASPERPRTQNTLIVQDPKQRDTFIYWATDAQTRAAIFANDTLVTPSKEAIRQILQSIGPEGKASSLGLKSTAEIINLLSDPEIGLIDTRHMILTKQDFNELQRLKVEAESNSFSISGTQLKLKAFSISVRTRNNERAISESAQASYKEHNKFLLSVLVEEALAQREGRPSKIHEFRQSLKQTPDGTDPKLRAMIKVSREDVAMLVDSAIGLNSPF